MKRTTLYRTLPIAALLATATFAVADQTGAADRIREFIAQGTLSLDIRSRFEKADQTNADGANAFTVRTRMGYATPSFWGITGMVEAENTFSPFPNAYNQAGLNPGGAGRTVVNDPTGTGINQAWLRYTYGSTTFQVGRQRLNFDNGRFIGDDGWRQNMQTFDAAVVENHSFEKLALTYAYIYRVNRVVGENHSQGVYGSNSHAVRAAYSGVPGGTLTAYAYLLEFDAPVVANSSATYGVIYHGERSFEWLKVNYRAEYANQGDYGNSPLFYSADYLAGEVNAGIERVSIGYGFETQGSENGFPFRAPLGSLHAFNGWADAFTLTPALGLRDNYVKIAGTLPWNIGVLAYYHKFSTDTGLRLGSEIDVQATYQINDSLGAVVKYASFSPDSTSVPDIKRVWLQLDLRY